MEAAVRNSGVDLSRIESLILEDKERIGAPKMVKKLVEMSTGDIVVFLGDDTLPEPDWLNQALKAMETLPDGWGLVGLNDQIFGPEKPATHWVADKRLLPFLDGELFHTGYIHQYCDNELGARCVDLGRYVWCKEAKIIHNHPINFNKHLTMAQRLQRTNDETYKRVYSEPVYNHDHALFTQRMANNWKAADSFCEAAVDNSVESTPIK
jgi:GT2 family glycosyltransferase